MADNTLGSGYLYSAKPFNVINPTGIDPGQAVDILKEVSENAKNRAFQAQEGARDRSAKAQMAQQELTARSQSEDKERSSRENLTREQMKQQQGQFDEEQAAQQLQHDHEMELNRQQFQYQQKQDATANRLRQYSEQAALERQKLENQLNRIMANRSQFTPPDSIGMPGAEHGTVGSGPSVGGDASVFDQFNVFSEDEAQQGEKDFLDLQERVRDADSRIMALNALQSFHQGFGDVTKVDENGDSIGAKAITSMLDVFKARLEQVTKMDPLLTSAIINAASAPSFVGEESWMAVPGRAIRASLPGYSVAGKTAANAIMPGLGGLFPQEGRGDSFQERYEADKWTQAGMQPPPTFAERTDNLSDAITEQVAPKDIATVSPMMRTMFKNLMEAAAVNGQERTGKLGVVADIRRKLTSYVDPELLDHAMYQLWRTTSTARKTTDLQTLSENANDPPVEEGGVRLTAGDKQTQGLRASADSERMKTAAALYRDLLVDELDHKTGKPTGNRVPLIKGWGVQADPVRTSKEAGESIVKAVLSLSKSGDPIQALELLTDDDLANDPQGPGVDEGQALLKKMHPQMKEVLRKLIHEHRLAAVPMLRDAGLNTDMDVGALKEEIKKTERARDQDRFETTSKWRKKGSEKIRAKQDEVYDAIDKNITGQQDVLAKLLGGDQ